MDIKFGTVKSNIDLFKSGRILVSWDDYPEGVEVRYVSPYVTTNNLGFMAVPEVGTNVLICQPGNENQWYYMGSILESVIGDSLGSGKITGVGNKDPFVDPYRFRGVVPQSYIFSSPKGNKILLSDAYNATESYLGTFLQSSRGMKINMNDSAGMITISNSTNNALITITENNMRDNTSSNGPASFTVQVTGNVSITSQQGDLDLTVINGRTLNITNKTGLGTGAKNDPTVGNINITSNHGDINIEAKGAEQQINIDATGVESNVSMTADGVVQVTGKQGVFIESSDGDINIRGNKIYLN